MKLFILLYGIAGILTGSFLNVSILRIPEGRSFISGRSACPVCGRTLRALELVPVLSWLFLGGKCRWCRANISIQYPAVELGMGILFSLTCFFRGTGFRSVILCAFFSLIITAAFIDGRHFYIPDGLSLLVLILGIVGFFADHGRFWPEFLRRMAGLVICGGGLWLLRILTGGGIGLGDVKMMAACGFFLGWPHGFCAMAAGYVLASVFCLPLLLSGRADPKDRLPMMPFFTAALIMTVLFGNELGQWYMGLWGL